MKLAHKRDHLGLEILSTRIDTLSPRETVYPVAVHKELDLNHQAHNKVQI